MGTTTVNRGLAKGEGGAFAFTPEERARLGAMTDEQAETAARKDPDNPPLDEARLACLASPVQRPTPRGA